MKGAAIFLIVVGLGFIGYFYLQDAPNQGHAQNRMIGMSVGVILILRGALSILARRQ